MSSGDGKSASADHVACGAEDLGPVSGVVRDLATVLHVLRVAEKNRANNLLLNGAFLVTDGGSGESSALTDGMLMTDERIVVRLQLTSNLQQRPWRLGTWCWPSSRDDPSQQ